MNIKTDRDGLEMVKDRGRWTLYLVEDDGRKYTEIGTIHGYKGVELLSQYLASGPRRGGNDNRRVAGGAA